MAYIIELFLLTLHANIFQHERIVVQSNVLSCIFFMKKIITLLFCCMMTVMVHAFTLSGTVRTDSARVLPFVSVYLKDMHAGSTTDLDGKYTIKDIPAGHHTLVLSYVGYESQIFEFDLTKDGVRDFVMHEQTVTLDEVFVTPTGESIERFILNQVVKNTKKLAKRASSFHCTNELRMEQRGFKLKVLLEPRIKTVNFFLGVLGFKEFVGSLMNNPDLKVVLTKDKAFSGGKLSVSNAKVKSSSPKLTSKQEEAWVKLFSREKDNDYDRYYEGLADVKKKVDKMERKTAGSSASHLSYVGGYEDNGVTVHIIKYDNKEYHIVDGCWQLRRIVTHKNGRGHSGNTEFHEFAKNVYMPVSKYIEFDLDLKKFLKEELDDLNKENTAKMSAKKLAEHNDRLEKVRNALNSEVGIVKASASINYRDFKSAK